MVKQYHMPDRLEFRKRIWKSYFDLLETTLYDNDLINRLCQIFNTDGTGMPLDPKPLKVYGAVSQKNFYFVTTGKKRTSYSFTLC